MKTSFRNLFGWGSILALTIGFNASTVAGPGPQFPQRPASADKVRADVAKEVAAAATQPSTAPAMACAACKTAKVQEFAGTNGKVAPHYTTVGTKHECASCGGAVATVRGTTANSMKDNCPICAKAKTAGAPCCSATS